MALVVLVLEDLEDLEEEEGEVNIKAHFFPAVKRSEDDKGFELTNAQAMAFVMIDVAKET